MESKKDIRAAMKGKEREFLLSAEVVRRETDAIWAGIEASRAFRDATTVLLYMAIEGEVPTDAFISKWYGKKRLVIPKVNGDRLDLFEYAPDRLQNGYKGISEPADDATPVDPSEIELALVPGVAFTRDGKRLGRGKGFYDRLLPSLNCPRFGVGFSFRWIDDIPADPWDVTLDLQEPPELDRNSSRHPEIPGITSQAPGTSKKLF